MKQEEIITGEWHSIKQTAERGRHGRKKKEKDNKLQSHLTARRRDFFFCKYNTHETHTRHTRDTHTIMEIKCEDDMHNKN